MNDISRQSHSTRHRLHDWSGWLLVGAATSFIALGGAFLGKKFVHDLEPEWSFVQSLCHWDGEHFGEIVENGYSFTPGEKSVVNFFPAYPIVAKGLAWATGISTAWALVIVSNVFCLGAFVLMGEYLRRRSTRSIGTIADGSRPEPGITVGQAVDNAIANRYALWAMGLFPTTFFFRMAYGESMFLCVAIAALYAMARGWRLPLIALLVGLATAVRPVGVALLVPMAWHVWMASSSKTQFTWRLAYAVPLGCWGLTAYMAFQYWKFDDLLAFAKAHAEWHLRPTPALGHKLVALLTGQPIWRAYIPGASESWKSIESWRKFTAIRNPIFSLPFANPIYFVGTTALVVVGAWRRWLTSYEVLVSIPLLAIPYFDQGYVMCMNGQGRYAAVVFPAYIVLGNLLARLPTPVSIAILGLSGLLLASYAALFATGHVLT